MISISAGSIDCSNNDVNARSSDGRQLYTGTTTVTFARCLMNSPLRHRNRSTSVRHGPIARGRSWEGGGGEVRYTVSPPAAGLRNRSVPPGDEFCEEPLPGSRDHVRIVIRRRFAGGRAEGAPQFLVLDQPADGRRQ